MRSIFYEVSFVLIRFVNLAIILLLFLGNYHKWVTNLEKFAWTVTFAMAVSMTVFIHSWLFIFGFALIGIVMDLRKFLNGKKPGTFADKRDDGEEHS